MKLSYVISVIVGGTFFGILYIGLDFNIILSLIFSIISYYASIMIFRERGPEDDLTIDSDLFYSQKLSGESLGYINKIEVLVGKIENKELSTEIKEICNISRKIVNVLKENPQKSNQVRKYADYYLPFTLNILTQYNTVEDQKLTSKESKAFMLKVETMILRVKEASKTQLNNMYETDIVNTNADIKVFETMLKTDGLVDDNMKIKLEREVGELNE